MKIIRPIILFSFLFFLVVSWGCEDNRKVDYQLQEQCGKKCEDIFDDLKTKTQDSSYVKHYIYQNHYNKKMNKCFILLTSFIEGNSNYMLMDVNERKLYGFFTDKKDGIDCKVLEKNCKSKDEWEQLIKPYMEE